MKKVKIYIILFFTCIYCENKINPIDGYSDDRFGQSVLIEDDWIFIGANRDFHNNVNSGSVYIYTYQNNSNPVLYQKITPEDSSNDQFFGKTIAYDNGWLAISAIYDAQYGYKSGAVYLFYFDGVNWVEHSKITAFDATAYDRFGYSIDIDNNRLVVGSIYDDDSGDNSRSVYLYDLINNSWILISKISPNFLNSSDLFGYSVALGFGYLAISAPQSDLDVSDGGVVNLFSLQSDSLLNLGYIIPNDLNQYNNFGNQIYIDEKFMFITSIYDDDLTVNAGSVYVYQKIESDWVYHSQLFASDGFSNDNFGISISFDNDWLSVGSYDDDNGINSGSLYLFKLIDNVFIEQSKILSSDGSQYDEFSASNSIKNNYLIVGSRLDDDNGNNSGSAYLYKFKGCKDYLACNYEENAILSDSSQCIYPQFGFECNGNCLSIIDECGICGGNGNNGDANFDYTLNIIDVVMMVDYIFDYTQIDNICVLDLNSNGELNITDIVLLIENILAN